VGLAERGCGIGRAPWRTLGTLATPAGVARRRGWTPRDRRPAHRHEALRSPFFMARPRCLGARGEQWASTHRPSAATFPSCLEALSLTSPETEIGRNPGAGSAGIRMRPRWHRPTCRAGAWQSCELGPRRADPAFGSARRIVGGSAAGTGNIARHRSSGIPWRISGNAATEVEWGRCARMHRG
jgi:hypothetical protein